MQSSIRKIRIHADFRRPDPELNLAIALATCGIPCVPVSTLNEKTGQRITELDFGPTGHLPAPVLPAEDPHQIRARFDLNREPGTAHQAWDMDTAFLRLHLRGGSLHTVDPAHPALDVLETLNARDCYRDFLKHGTRYRCLTLAGAPRAVLVPGEDPLRITHSQGDGLAKSSPSSIQTWHTADLALAAAMSRIGCPVLDITGPPGSRMFTLPRFGHVLQGRATPEDALGIAHALRSLGDDLAHGDLALHCPEHPVLWGYMGCKNRLHLEHAVEAKGWGRQVFLHNPRSAAWRDPQRRRSALVEERAPDCALDDAMQHLRK